MERNLHNYPSFLKLLMEEDFSKEIRIPNNFTRKYFKNKLPKKCLLKCTAGSGNKSWPVRICRKGNNNDDVLYICKDAWPNFVKDHKLKYGDYVLFWLVNKSTFFVITYGSDSNRKFDFSYDEKSESDSLLEDDDTDDDDDDDDLDPSDGIRVKEENSGEREETVDEYNNYYVANLENPYFIKKFRPSHLQQMAIPAGFIKETKFDFKETMVLHGEDDREWTVKIWRRGGRLIMTEGWTSFLGGYEPKIGDTYKFTLLRNLGNVFSVELILPS